MQLVWIIVYVLCCLCIWHIYSFVTHWNCC